MGQGGYVRRRGKTARGTRPAYQDLIGKYGHGLALGPQAEMLAEALLRLNGRDALKLLLSQHAQGESLEDIERATLEPALLKVAELWTRGRVEDSRFEQLTNLAENVERQFRLVVASPSVLGPMKRPTRGPESTSGSTPWPSPED